MIDTCFKIIELWKGNYTDKEIKESLGLTNEQFRHCLDKIQSDPDCFTDCYFLFQRGVMRLKALEKKIELELEETEDLRHRATLIRELTLIPCKIADIAVKYGINDMVRVIREVKDSERAKWSTMSLPELIAEAQKQNAKWD